MEGVAGFLSVCGDAGELLTNSNFLEVPQKWTFCAIFFRWTKHFQYPGVKPPSVLRLLPTVQDMNEPIAVYRETPS